jgi:hypothetical protein
MPNEGSESAVIAKVIEAALTANNKPVSPQALLAVLLAADVVKSMAASRTIPWATGDEVAAAISHCARQFFQSLTDSDTLGAKAEVEAGAEGLSPV